MAKTEFLIAGLGNPGAKYAGTPHNAGFGVVDTLAASEACRLRRSLRFSAAMAGTRVEGVDVRLVKPLTYMNRSGYAVAACMRYYKIPPQRMLVIADDIDIPLGTLRLRGEGSSGGHKGLQSIIEQTGSNAFPRLKVGVGRDREGGDVVSHVLTPFSRLENECFQRVLDIAAQAVRCMLTQGMQKTMNRFNGTVTNCREPEPETQQNREPAGVRPADGKSNGVSG